MLLINDHNVNGATKLKVTIYTKPGCPYCAKAREFYTEKGIDFEDLNAQDNLKYRKKMLAFTNGDPTVPTIIEDGKLKQIGWEGRG
jgi:glutaredoxin 3